MSSKPKTSARIRMLKASPGYGRSKPGRPKAPPPIPTGPTCETCRSLVCAGAKARCAHGRVLDPVNCPDFRSAARESMHGGTWGGRIV